MPFLHLNPKTELTKFTMSDNPATALFQRLFDANRDKVFRFACKLTGDPSRAEEITQQCFIRLWEKMHQVEEGKDIFPLLFVLVKRLVIDDARRLYREQQKIAQLSAQNPDTVNSLPLLQKEMQQHMQQAIEKMPEQRRMVYLMSRNEGRSYKEIAVQMGLSPATVRNHLSLALQFIRQEMAIYLAE